ncbi:MAG: hypothetical protein O7G32_14400 [SAR324 cluster bacterium]|nr:hypothetical protein [SAR324 cluster bacterium]
MVFDAVAQHRGGTLSTRSFCRIVAENRQGGAGDNGMEGGTVAEISLSLNSGKRFPTLQESEEFLIREAMTRAGGNQIIASEKLGITRSAQQRRLNRFSS